MLGSLDFSQLLHPMPRYFELHGEKVLLLLPSGATAQLSNANMLPFPQVAVHRLYVDVFSLFCGSCT